MLRGQLTDSLAHVRRAIEQCAFAARIAEHPAFAEASFGLAETQDLYELCWRKGSLNKIPNQELSNKVVQLIAENYDFCCKNIHAYLKEMAVDHGEASVQFEFSELSNEGISLVKRYVFIVHNHLLILAVFQDVLHALHLDRARLVSQRLEKVKNRFESVTAELKARFQVVQLPD